MRFAHVAFTFVIGLATASAPAYGSPPEVAELLQKLPTTSGEERLAVIDALTDHGHAAAPATDALAALLGDSDEAVRGRAARALGAIGPEAAGAVDKLTAVAKDSSPKVRAYAMYALGMIGPPAKGAFPAVAEALNDSDAMVRREAVKAMTRIKPPLDQAAPALIAALENAQTAGETMPALHALVEAGPAAVPRLIEAMERPDARFWACRILAEIGPPAGDAVPALTTALADDRMEVRREAAMALGRIGADARSAAPKLVELLSDVDPGVRASALWALLMCEAAPGDILPKVQGLLNDSDEMVRVVAHWGAAKLDPSDEQARRKAILLLVRTLKNDNPRIRAAAAHALVDLRAGDDESVMSAFIERLNDGDNVVVGVAAESIVRRGADAVPRLIKALQRKELQDFAMGVLGRIGPAAKDAVPPLLALSSDSDARVRAGAVLALGAIAPQEPPVALRLIAALADESSDVRLAGVAALAHSGAPAGPVRAALEKLSTDPDPRVAEAAAYELSHKTK